MRLIFFSESTVVNVSKTAISTLKLHRRLWEIEFYFNFKFAIVVRFMNIGRRYSKLTSVALRFVDIRILEILNKK